MQDAIQKKAADGKESREDDWICVDKRDQEIIDNTRDEPFKEHRFPIEGKQRFVKAIKFKVERNRGAAETQLNKLDIYC